MICNICGKNYVQLAVHLRLKHKMDPYDYRMEYNIPLQTALADGELRDHLSKQAKLRMLTEEGVNHIRRILDSSRGVDRVRRALPEASTQHCHKNNEAKALSFREKKLPGVLKSWLAGDSLRDITVAHGVSFAVLKKWQRAGYLPKRALVYVVADKED